jgi:hypothetical protein
MICFSTKLNNLVNVVLRHLTQKQLLAHNSETLILIAILMRHLNPLINAPLTPLQKIQLHYSITPVRSWASAVSCAALI